MSKKKSRHKITTRQFIGIGLSLLFFSLLWGSFSWAEYRGNFQLNRLRIYGGNIQTNERYREILGPVEGADIRDIKLNEVRLVLEANPFVEAVRVSRQYPSTMTIEIKERLPIAMMNRAPFLFLDKDAVVLPDNGYSQDAILPILSGFNPAQELYPTGQKTFSIKVKEAVEILNQLSQDYHHLYNNLSEMTLNKNDEFVLILSDRPTKVILGKNNIWTKIRILKEFEQALIGQRHLTDYKLLDMRYNKQVIAKEWT